MVCEGADDGEVVAMVWSHAGYGGAHSRNG